jgi:hypothetical protein
MTARKTLLALALALLGTGLLAPPASAGNASPQSASDPAGDGHGRGDIRSVRVAQYGGPLILQVRTQLGVRADTAAAWSSATSKTQLRFYVNHVDDANPDFSVIIRATADGPVGEVTGFPNRPRGECVTVTQPRPTLIRASIALVCLPEVASAATFARYRFDRGGDGSINSIDRGPNAGMTPLIDFVG